jgi:hypothetical protein
MDADGLPSVQLIELERTASNTRIIEILFGIFGGFGLGWLYAGNIQAAVALLIFSVFYATIAWSIVTASVGICSCLFFPLSLAVAFVSGNNARAWAMKNRAEGSVLRLLAGAVVIGAMVIIGVLIVGASIAAMMSQY